MTPELVDDLKQFIEAAFVQHLSGVNARLDVHDQRFDQIDQRFLRIDQRFTRMEGRFDDLDAKLDTVIDTFGDMLVDHDGRIGKLEAYKA